MSGNRVLFSIVLGILALLLFGLLVLASGSSEGPPMLAGLVQLLVGIGAILLSVRLLRNISGRR